MKMIDTKMREKEISQIVSYIKNGEFCQLIGVPGVGREQVFELLNSSKAIRNYHLGEEEKYYHFVLINFAELRNKTLQDVIKLIFLELSDSLRERKYTKDVEEVSKYLQDSLHHNDGIILLQGLKRSIEYLSNSRKLHVVFLLDRFEEFIPSVSDEFFVELSTLQRRASTKFSVVFALTRPLEHSVEPELFKDAYELLAGNRVYMTIKDEAIVKYEVEKIQEEYKSIFSETIISEVIELTGGHRKMLILSFEALSRAEKKEELGKKVLMDSLSVRGASYQIWNSLRPQEQELLKRQISTEGMAIEVTEDEEKRVKYLEDVGLLDASSFTIPLFASFVGYRVEHKLDERLIYKADEKRVFIGEGDITDIFTSSEKKALLFLMDHADSVVSRDDLICAVWSDAVTTHGVTDQAVDQLIYRIRRKIEPDFSQPKYLLTAKGIGFKFVF